MGSAEGMRWHPGLKYPNDLEPVDSFLQRISAWWDTLLKLDTAANEGKVIVALVVGHGAWIGFLLRHLHQSHDYEVLPDANHTAIRPWHIENASLQLVQTTRDQETDDPKGVILKWNDKSHLQDLDVVHGSADFA